MDRRALVTSLIRLDAPLGNLRDALAALPMDATPVATLTRADIAAIVQRFQAGEITAGDVELWATLVECREDIAFEARFEPAIADALYDLANPEGPLEDLADDVLALLGQR
ncbi:hypothetical protein [Pedomonas mirosovicensis]|uniref:hypothetical protein n=1 Tax=Pedomonas mirosovicensis TaxID=2908641 RepID=UPI00216A93E8|nr:hypothetical protein [Pedomonas mirosovicensis]MCH8684508.1 hypothetical protein [Pedomonas mirosovicensis]